MPTMSILEVLLCRGGPWRWLSRRMLPWSTQGLTLAGEVLEIGGGSGAMAAELARTNPHVRLTMTDLDPTMVRAARHRFAHLPHATAQQADATHLPYDNESFDRCVASACCAVACGRCAKSSEEHTAELQSRSH